MLFCFLADDHSVCKMIIQRLTEKGHIGFIQDDWVDLRRNLFTSRRQIDIIICDFSYAANHVIDIFEIIKEAQKQIPVIFYNDPTPSDSERAAHWLAINQFAYGQDMNESIINEFENFNKIITDPKIRRHIPLLQHNKPVEPYIEESELNSSEIDLNAFRRRNRLTPALFRVFKFMYENRKKELSIKDIAKGSLDKSDKCGNRASTVYSYISRLRKTIENDNFARVDIVRTAKGSYEMLLY